MRRDIVWLILGAVIVLAIVALSSCAEQQEAAQKPVCPTVNFTALQASSGAWYFVLDVEGLDRLAHMQRDLADGKCRLPTPAELAPEKKGT